MANKSTAAKNKSKKTLSATKLEKENEALRAELEAAKASKRQHSLWRPFGAVVFVAIAVASLLLFNASLWVRDTVMNTDQFVATVQPLIKDPDVQKLLQTEITNELFSQINIEAELKKVLPENVAFIAAPFADQVKSFTYGRIGNLLNSDQGYKIWTTVLTTSHAKILAYIQNPNNSGVITVNSIYELAGSELKDTDVGFLFGKTLPSTVGDIQIADIKGIPQARKALNALQGITTTLGVVVVISSLLAILVSVKRRKTIVILSALMLAMMLAMLLAIKIADTQVGSMVQQQYAAAAQATYSIIAKPLTLQTEGFAAFAGAIIVIAVFSSSCKYVAWLHLKLREGLDWLNSKVVGKWAQAAWISWISTYRVIICWVLVSISFVAFALRLPPTVGGSEAALIASAIFALILEVFGSIARVAKK